MVIGKTEACRFIKRIEHMRCRDEEMGEKEWRINRGGNMQRIDGWNADCICGR